MKLICPSILSGNSSEHFLKGGPFSIELFFSAVMSLRMNLHYNKEIIVSYHGSLNSTA